jgi:hypothetical protein
MRRLYSILCSSSQRVTFLSASLKEARAVVTVSRAVMARVINQIGSIHAMRGSEIESQLVGFLCAPNEWDANGRTYPVTQSFIATSLG